MLKSPKTTVNKPAHLYVLQHICLLFYDLWRKFVAYKTILPQKLYTNFNYTNNI